MPNSRQWYSWVDYQVSPTPPADAQEGSRRVLWALKAALLGQIAGPSVGPEGPAPSSARWTIAGSYDGTTAAYDSVDRWGSSYDPAKIPLNSWMILKAPAALGTIYLYLQWNIGNNGMVSINIGDHLLAGDSAPYAGSMSPYMAQATFPGSGGGQTFVARNGPSDDTSRIHFTTTSDGDFWFFYSENGKGGAMTCVSVSRLTNLRKAGDPYPVALVIDWNDTQTGITGYQGTRGALQDGHSNFFRNNNGSVCCWSYNGVASRMSVIVPFCGTNTNFMQNMGAYEGDGTWDTAPCTIFNINGLIGLKGDFVDLAQVSQSAVPGTRQPATGLIERVVFGNVLIPFSVIPSL